jgi:hypothetical protein
MDDAERPLGGVPVLEVKALGRPRWISLPFTDATSPLVVDAHAAGLERELSATMHAARVRRFEIRGTFPGRESVSTPVALSHVIRLGPDPDAVHARFRAQVRRNLQTAERAGLIVRRAETERDLVETFYRLQPQTRRRLGVPIQPRPWFRLLWRRILEPGLGFLTLAYDGRTPVAGGVFLTWNGRITNKYSASSTAGWGLRPNNAIFWDAIRFGCVEGFTDFDFGRTDSDADGLRRFKLGWGSIEQPLRYTFLGEQPRPRAHGGELAQRVIRRSPPVVTRVLGELLYRYVA